MEGGFSRAGTQNQLKDHYAELQNKVAQKNGYVYIYVSNESAINVFFDNLQVVHTRGPILEETHYYPFGLTMAGISSRAINNSPENRYKFNSGTELSSKDFSDGSGLELYETPFRSYDAQIGRFHQIDPLAEVSFEWSSYAFCLNNPILLSDPLGLCGDTIPFPKIPKIPQKSLIPHTSLTITPQIVPSTGKPSTGGTGGGSDIAPALIAGLTRTNPYVAAGTGALLGGAAIWYLFFGDYGGGATGAIPPSGALPWDNTGRRRPIVIAPPTDLPIVGSPSLPPPPLPTLNIALSADKYLFDFAQKTNSIPYSKWGEYQPKTTTVSAYISAIITLGLLPNTRFHFNLSTPNGLLNTPTNLSSNANSILTAEYATIMTFFRHKTTFYIKSGSIYKPTTVN